MWPFNRSTPESTIDLKAAPENPVIEGVHRHVWSIKSIQLADADMLRVVELKWQVCLSCGIQEFLRVDEPHD